jgi:uncharacterized cupredoxin-like copper-binding protein
MKRRAIVAPLVAAGLVGVFGAAGLAGAGGGAVTVTLKEWKVIPKPTSLTAGKVVFTAKNTGTIEHELIVIQSNLAPAKLPLTGARVNEDKVKVMGEVEVAKGKSKKLTLTMKKGNYVFICNLPGHYKNGQYAGFKVK